jgi:transcriptional regulator with XRE-family HTH domain
MTPKHAKFGQYLTRQRKAAGLSLRGLAEQIGASKTSVHNWETGEWLPEIALLEPLAQALGTSYEELFVRAGYDVGTLPQPEPYLRAKFPGISDRKFNEARRLFEQIEAAEHPKKGRRR